ncbi:phage tail tape measure protein [Paraburkholderia sp. BR10923]|uniref:phage tail tape measure protein n=1 Tax=Paraburkholderia sp. BR10923 TaxID=3236992 RepID=UPI0034CD66E4
MLIDEYLVKLGVTEDSAKARSFRMELGRVAGTATKAFGIITAAYGAITAYFGDAVGKLAELGDVARETGTSVAFLQEIGYAAEQTGSSVEAAQQSMVGLTRVMGEAANGVGRGAKIFDKFGLSVRDANGQVRDVSDVIGQIQAKMQDMALPQQRAFLARLGIDPSMRRMLALNSEEFGKLIDRAREWGVYGDEQAEVADRLKLQFNDLRFGLGQLRTLIGLALVPEMSRSIDTFKSWFRANRENIIRGMTMAYQAISLTIGMVSNFVKALDDVIGPTIGWRGAMLLLAAAWMFFNRSMLLNPLTWVIAALVVLMALVDDFMVYMKGGQSAINWGPMLEYFNKIAEAVRPAIAALEPLMKVIGLILELVGRNFADVFVAAFKIIIDAFATLIELIANGIVGLVALAHGDVKGFVDAFLNGFKIIGEFAKRTMENIGQYIENAFGRMGAIVGALARGQGISGAIAAMRTVPIGSPGSPAGQLGPGGFGGGVTAPLPAPAAAPTTTNINQRVSVSVHSTDPHAAGRETEMAINSAGRRANVNNAPTVKQ